MDKEQLLLAIPFFQYNPKKERGKLSVFLIEQKNLQENQTMKCTTAGHRNWKGRSTQWVHRNEEMFASRDHDGAQKGE